MYHSEEAENQFMKDPSKAVLGDGVSGNLKGKSNSGGRRNPFDNTYPPSIDEVEERYHTVNYMYYK